MIEQPEPSMLKTIAYDRAIKGDGIAAMMAAQLPSGTRKKKGERDTEFIKRVGRAYLLAVMTSIEVQALHEVGSVDHVRAVTKLIDPD